MQTGKNRAYAIRGEPDTNGGEVHQEGSTFSALENCTGTNASMGTEPSHL